MSNLFISKTLSRKPLLKDKKKRKLNNSASLTIKVILSLNNVFIFVVKETQQMQKIILDSSVGQIGFKNTKKGLFTSAWLLGKKVGEFLVKLPDWVNLKKKLVIYNAFSSDYRLRFVLRGFKDYRIVFNKIFFLNKAAFNGCKKKHLGRTGRKRRVFFN